MAELQALDCKTILRDIFDSEEFKIESNYSEKLKKTIQRICEDGDEEFEKCYERVRKEVEELVATSRVNKKEQPYFRDMFLYTTEKLPKVLEDLTRDLRQDLTEDLMAAEQPSCNYRGDPIIWQVAS